MNCPHCNTEILDIIALVELVKSLSPSLGETLEILLDPDQARQIIEGLNHTLPTSPLEAIMFESSPRDIYLIINTVCQYYGISPEKLRDNGKTRPVARARFVVSYIARVMLQATYSDIGRALNKDHSTIINGVKRTSQLLRSNPVFARQVDSIGQTILKKMEEEAKQCTYQK